MSITKSLLADCGEACTRVEELIRIASFLEVTPCYISQHLKPHHDDMMLGIHHPYRYTRLFAEVRNNIQDHLEADLEEATKL